jgi:hypothetical protein
VEIYYFRNPQNPPIRIINRYRYRSSYRSSLGEKARPSGSWASAIPSRGARDVHTHGSVDVHCGGSAKELDEIQSSRQFPFCGGEESDVVCIQQSPDVASRRDGESFEMCITE